MLLDDVHHAGMVYAVLLRSPISKGKIKELRLPKTPAGVDVVLPSAIPGANRLLNTGLPLLADSVVSYIGEPLAIILAAGELEAESYAAECQIQIEEESPAYSIETFTKDNIIEEYRIDNNTLFSDGGTGGGGASPNNQFAGESGMFVGNTYQTGVQYHWSCEPCGAAAVHHGDVITVTLAAADSALVRTAVSQTLGLADGDGRLKIALLPPGLHFELKTLYPAQIACYAALAAHITKKNVRLLLSRDEEMLYSAKRARARFCISSNIDSEGIVQKTLIEARYDYGAGNLWAMADGANNGSMPLRSAPLYSGLSAMGRVYNLGDIEASGVAVRTNLPPAGPFCGGGISQALFALENHVNSIADSLAANGLDWRLENLTKNSAILPASTRKALVSLLEKAGELSDFRRKRAAYKALAEGADDKIILRRGIGLSLSAAGIVPAVSVVEIEIDRVSYTPILRNVWFLAALPPKEAARRSQAAAGLAQSAADAPPVSIPFTKQRQKALHNAVKTGLNAALGWALSEKIDYVNGKLSPDISSEYGMIPPSETPPVHIEFIEADFDEKQRAFYYEPSHLSEAPFNTAPSAFLQAVSEAIGHEFVKIPLTPANIWNYLRKREEGAKL
ncbi:MAG: xanthine dehydrogenase family protein molybdopterin-binding subunit [Spirochaetaceae bacterium]|jgi:CO/xanthine dehydrogenase Mo-binding subunit|nr:xanthine dehydrogenase family protein molybdopterin-binding subunit [Spirochaetaceae bacterium]